MKTEPKVVYEFGPFRMDPDKQVLYRDGEPVPVKPKAFEMLLVLVCRNREVVSKEELLNAVWPNTIVEEANLTQNIFMLRKALGDTPEERQYIVTLPGRGYRFAAHVRTVTDQGDAMVAQMRSRTEIVIEEPPFSPRTLEPALPAPARSQRKRILATLALVFVVTFLVVAALLFRSRRMPLSAKDSILVADLANLTGDPSFDEALRQGIEVQLEQSPYLRLVSDDQIAQALKLMGQSPEAHLTGQVVRDVCMRTESAAILESFIQSVGSEYVVNLRSINCKTGEVIDTEQEQVARKEDILSAISRMTRIFRQRVGESGVTLQQHDMPLAQATTFSLDALKAYSLGLKVVSISGEEAALPFFKRAVEIDSNFAMAYAYLALMYGSIGESQLATDNARRAYDLRDHANDNERFFISAYYFGRATGNQEKARQVCQQWAQTYPRDPLPHAFLSAFIYPALANYDKAIEEGIRARDLAPERAYVYVNLGEDALYVNRFDLARSSLDQAKKQGLDNPLLTVLKFDLAFAQNEASAMQQAIKDAQGKPDAMDWLMDRQAFDMAYHGQLRRARALSNEATSIAQQLGDHETAALFATRAALREAFFGEAAQARQDAARALSLTRNREVEYGCAVALALAGDPDQAEHLAEDLDKRFPEDTSIHFSYLPVIHALLALQHGDSGKAIGALEASAPYELGSPRCAATAFYGALYPILVRAQALLTAHKYAESAREFQRIVDNRSIMTADPVSIIAIDGLARSHALAGEPTRSAAEYRQFLDLWKDADPDLAIFKEAKTELARLR